MDLAIPKSPQESQFCWATRFYTVVVLLFEKFTAEFSASALVVHKILPPMGPEILYTTGLWLVSLQQWWYMTLCFGFGRNYPPVL